MKKNERNKKKEGMVYLQKGKMKKNANVGERKKEEMIKWAGDEERME